MGQLLPSISNAELTYHLLLQSFDPVGPERDDLRAAISTSSLVNTQIPKKKDYTKPKDFLTGEFLRKHHRRSMGERGVKPEWDKQKFWKRWWAIAKGNTK